MVVAIASVQPHVVVEQGAEVAMPGLRGDAVDRGAVASGGRGVAGPERVSGHGDADEAGRYGPPLDRPADRSRSDALGGGVVAPEHAGEQCARSVSRLSSRATPTSAARVLVGLGPADADQDSGQLTEDVLDVEGRDFAGAHREAWLARSPPLV